ncbi:MAG: peptide chain release factor N(5)-glutamine methyltransferase [Chloroflexi bacterium]|nr:peptide chain release factor N(5)-glutamine methyltransferase [Chloroflexota bacterium]
MTLTKAPRDAESRLIETLRDAESRLRDAEIEDARLEAEILLCHALSLTREALFARLREPLPTDVHATFESLLRRRLDHEPTAYIVGHREFYGLSFACAPAALIPRPETELLVEAALSWIDRWEQGRVPRPTTHDPRPRIVDVGTGGGAIAVALAVHCPTARIVAIDPSRQALALARCNAAANGVSRRIDFVQGELLTPLPGRFDLIVANLPYVPTRLYEKLPPEIREHEPAAALHAGRRGTALIEALLAQARARLHPGGLLLAEHAWNQGQRLREAARVAFPAAAIETRRDLAGRQRMLVVRQS